MIICTVLIFDTYMTIAIDFGTSNTVVTRWNPVTQQPETLTLSGLSLKMADNPPLIPSLVYVEDAGRNEVIIGQNVRDRGLDLKSDPRFFRSFKRGIGADIQGFLPELDEEVITFEKVGELFLSSVINNLIQTEFLGKDVLESLILTVPVDSFETYRNWLGNVCQSLPVQQIRMIDEPTSSALGYGIK
jgi:molecular chaperone DnaK (HSP70)